MILTPLQIITNNTPHTPPHLASLSLQIITNNAPHLASVFPSPQMQTMLCQLSVISKS